MPAPEPPSSPSGQEITTSPGELWESDSALTDWLCPAALSEDFLPPPTWGLSRPPSVSDFNSQDPSSTPLDLIGGSTYAPIQDPLGPVCPSPVPRPPTPPPMRVLQALPPSPTEANPFLGGLETQPVGAGMFPRRASYERTGNQVLWAEQSRRERVRVIRARGSMVAEPVAEEFFLGGLSDSEFESLMEDVLAADGGKVHLSETWAASRLQVFWMCEVVNRIRRLRREEKALAEREVFFADSPSLLSSPSSTETEWSLPSTPTRPPKKVGPPT